MVVTYALVLPVLMAAVGFAVDYAGWAAQQRRLQGAADSAAIAAAREWYLVDASEERIDLVAETMARAQFQKSASLDKGLRIDTDIDPENDAVTVTVTQGRKAYFLEAVAASLSPLSATARARAFGGGRLCMVGLDEGSDDTVALQDRAKLFAPKCAVYSNADARAGVRVSDQAEIEAELVCSSGGADVGRGSVRPDEPMTDCPRIEDPLSARPAPQVGACDYDGGRLIDIHRPLDVRRNAQNLVNRLVLRPGTYCNGLTVSDVNITLAPGIYVITGGPLVVRSNVALFGRDVGFYLHGPEATLDFDARTIVDITAPRDGPMAGILFFEDRGAPPGRVHSIRSEGASNLLGTVYLSRGILKIDTNAPVAQDSAYTAIVARQVTLSRRPVLYLNADYDGSEVPVPSGMGPVGGNIVLDR